MNNSHADKIEYKAHYKRALKQIGDCTINLIIWSGDFDPKLRAEWDAAQALKVPTLVICVDNAPLTSEMEKSPIVRKVIPATRLDFKRKHFGEIVKAALDEIAKRQN